ncbi:hypothetical protein LCGC14_0164480 [marine sediment metagenome]|uniref:Uncharacterized protein n=1 Tax=marine sediment metagenome TaxID=412755 RepID=A0A0F9UYL2_9ZZZZ
MSDKSVVAFDPDALKKAIRGRVQAAFVDMIPDEAWDKMVSGEIDSFFKEPQKVVTAEEKRHSRNQSWQSDQYEISRVEMTPFRQVVYDQLRPLVIAEIVKRINSANFESVWFNEGEHRLGPFFEKILRDCVPEMVALMFKGVFARAAGATMESLRNQQF